MNPTTRRVVVATSMLWTIGCAGGTLDPAAPEKAARRLGVPLSFEEPRTGLRFVLVPGREGIRPFYLCATEVTNRAYQVFRPHHASAFGGSDHPVEMVTLSDAQAFTRWLGPDYRLPTEREWEHACRAGSTTGYSFGDRFDHRRANAAAGDPKKPEPRATTRAVASYPPNSWGLHDMHGNVMEWCLPETGGPAVARGGSWRYGIDQARSDGRFTTPYGSGDPDTGLRPARMVKVRLLQDRSRKPRRH